MSWRNCIICYISRIPEFFKDSSGKLFRFYLGIHLAWESCELFICSFKWDGKQKILIRLSFQSFQLLINIKSKLRKYWKSNWLWISLEYNIFSLNQFCINMKDWATYRIRISYYNLWFPGKRFKLFRITFSATIWKILLIIWMD